MITSLVIGLAFVFLVISSGVSSFMLTRESKECRALETVLIEIGDVTDLTVDMVRSRVHAVHPTVPIMVTTTDDNIRKGTGLVVVVDQKRPDKVVYGYTQVPGPCGRYMSF